MEKDGTSRRGDDQAAKVRIQGSEPDPYVAGTRIVGVLPDFAA
jgi:hypothetical protein